MIGRRIGDHRDEIHEFFMAGRRSFTSNSQPRRMMSDMADFLAVVGVVVFVLAMLGLIKGLEHV